MKSWTGNTSATNINMNNYIHAAQEHKVGKQHWQ